MAAGRRRTGTPGFRATESVCSIAAQQGGEQPQRQGQGEKQRPLPVGTPAATSTESLKTHRHKSKAQAVSMLKGKNVSKDLFIWVRYVATFPSVFFFVLFWIKQNLCCQTSAMFFQINKYVINNKHNCNDKFDFIYNRKYTDNIQQYN